MIFLTVGSIFFDEVVKEVDVAVGQGRINDEVVMQIGYGGCYEPVHCEYFRSAPGLDPLYKRADLVISHGGSTTFEVLERGLRLISVSNPHLSDNHQREFLEVLEDRGIVKYCRNLTELPAYIEDALLKPKPFPMDLSIFFRPIVDDIERWQSTPMTRAPMVRSMIEHALGKIPPRKFKFTAPGISNSVSR